MRGGWPFFKVVFSCWRYCILLHILQPNISCLPILVWLTHSKYKLARVSITFQQEYCSSLIVLLRVWTCLRKVHISSGRTCLNKVPSLHLFFISKVIVSLSNITIHCFDKWKRFLSWIDVGLQAYAFQMHNIIIFLLKGSTQGWVGAFLWPIFSCRISWPFHFVSYFTTQHTSPHNYGLTRLIEIQICTHFKHASTRILKFLLLIVPMCNIVKYNPHFSVLVRVRTCLWI